MPRPCLICSDHRKLARAAELIAAGNSDQAVANALNAMTPDMPAMSLMAVSRHRRAHILAPAKALAEAAGKGREVAEQRAQVLAAAEAGDPSAFVALAGIVADLRKCPRTPERTATRRGVWVTTSAKRLSQHCTIEELQHLGCTFAITLSHQIDRRPTRERRGSVPLKQPCRSQPGGLQRGLDFG